LLTELDSLFIEIVHSSLNEHVSDDEPLLVVGQLVLAEVELVLKLKLFEGPRVLLGDSLSCGSQEGFGVEQSTEPEATLSELRIDLEFLQLIDSLNEVSNPSSDLNAIRDLVLVPLGRGDFSEDLLTDEAKLVGTLPLTFTHFFQIQQVVANGLQKAGSDIHFSF
jgi:hypothetical protein